VKKPKSNKRDVKAKEMDTNDDFHLTKAQLRELDRRIADSKNPVRYLIEGGFGPRFRLYYNVSEDVYAMNNPAGATLFKRRRAAVAIQKLLTGGKRIIRCTTRRRKEQLIPVLPSQKKRTTKKASVTQHAKAR
jgi:hypothetical protein